MEKSGQEVPNGMRNERDTQNLEFCEAGGIGIGWESGEVDVGFGTIVSGTQKSRSLDQGQ